MVEADPRQRIIDAGRALVEAGGVPGLSMRKVAAEVGLAPTAIYWHVGSREDLLNAVLDEMIADLPPLVIRGRTPSARVASLARSLRAQVLATTHTQQLAHELGRSAALFFPAQVALAREVSAAGIHGQRAAEAVRAVLFVVGGFIVLEDNYRQGQTAPGTTRELWQAIEDPAIDAALRDAMSRPTTPDSLFDFTVERLIASLLR